MFMNRKLANGCLSSSFKNLIDWKISFGENPVLKHSGKNWEYDQTADPSPIITPDGGAYLFFDAVNHPAGKASIGLAIAKQIFKVAQKEIFESEIDFKVELF